MSETKKKIALFITTTILLSTISAVFFAAETVRLSHRKHIEEYGAECANCHTNGDSPGLKKDACVDCHDEAMAAKRAVLKRRAKKTDIPFPHALHENTAECVDCHGATAKDRQKRGRPIQAYRRCVSCHEENGIGIAARDCRKCHGRNEKRHRPTSHKKAWREGHGKTARWRFIKEHGDDCYLCHTRNDCKNCHKTMKPRSHTGLWRIKTHGLSASWDRERCKTCHETGSCINCHRTTAPMNHRGGWRSVHGLAAKTSGERCRVCHGGSYGSASQCIECHGRGR